VSDPAPTEERSRTDPTAQLPAMVTALMFAALVAAYTQVIAARRKGRDDHRRYQERMPRNHGEPRHEGRTPPED
jgi:hypothetical protein